MAAYVSRKLHDMTPTQGILSEPCRNSRHAGHCRRGLQSVLETPALPTPWHSALTRLGHSLGTNLYVTDGKGGGTMQSSAFQKTHAQVSYRATSLELRGGMLALETVVVDLQQS